MINLGNNQTVTLLQMIQALESALGRAATIAWLPEQPGDVPRTWANIEKAGRLLGYVPRTRLDEGIQRFAAWYLQSAPALSLPT